MVFCVWKCKSSSNFLDYNFFLPSWFHVCSQIGTCISAHGCWIYSKYHHPDNEESNGFLNGNVEEHSSVTLTYRTKQNRNMTKLQKYLEQEDKDQRAGFWGYAMQVIYQVSLSEHGFVSLFGACLCLLHPNRFPNLQLFLFLSDTWTDQCRRCGADRCCLLGPSGTSFVRTFQGQPGRHLVLQWCFWSQWTPKCSYSYTTIKISSAKGFFGWSWCCCSLTYVVLPCLADNGEHA